MPQFLGSPLVQYFDDNGYLLQGGQLFSYAPGTTTPQVTYPTIADATNQTNPNTNPVILDSRGEAQVVLYGSTKLVLEDSNGNVLWTVDNVGEGVNNIYDTNGNLLLAFTQVPNAVNYINVTNAASGSYPTIAGNGSDTNIGMNLSPKGTGYVNVEGNMVMNGFNISSGQINGFNYPTTDGLSGATLVTNGSKTLAMKYAPGTLLNIQVFTANGTYTPTVGTTKQLVYCTGGGGAGGSNPSTSSGYTASGGGGGATTVTLASMTGNQTVVLGLGGIAGGTTTGGATTIGTLGALGGLAGLAGNASGVDGGAGGALSGTYTYGITGLAGEGAFNGTTNRSGAGGGTMWGNGAPGVIVTGGTGINGKNATTPGAGGGGAANGASASASLGGQGANGVVIIYEYA